MTQQTIKSSSRTQYIAAPQYLIISILTIFSIGSQYFLNLSYNLNQSIIQKDLYLDSIHLFMPSTLSNVAFALGIPLGPVFTRRFGFKRNYLTFVFIFLCGSIISFFSPELITFCIGRILQGLSAGIIFFTVLPVSLRSFPSNIKNAFLFMVTIGLFGASAFGALFGSISLQIDSWRWLFVLTVLASLLCLFIGFFGIPKDEQKQYDDEPVDKKKLFLLTLTMVIVAIPLCNLFQKGYSSLYVWPFFVLAFILLMLFIYIDLKGKTPAFVPFGVIKAPKPISGTIMAVAAHVTLIVALAGIDGILQHNENFLPLNFDYFYLCFFVGIVVSAILQTVLFDKVGAGVLGLIGSIAVFYVSIQWGNIDTDLSLSSLYFQAACLGGGISMTLISGAIGTVLAGDMHQAAMRSVSLHSIRNFLGALFIPMVARFIITESHKKSNILEVYHELFNLMLVLAVLIMIASIGKIVTGKGKSLVKK